MSTDTIPATRMYRYEVPVDDQPHTFTLHSSPLAVACRDPRVVEFWAVHHDELDAGREYTFIVVGTGHPLPNNRKSCGWHMGTVVAPGGALVWHLIEVVPS